MAEQTTAKNTCWDNLGNGWAIEIPMLQQAVYIVKTMPCGHLGLLIKDKFVCQTCYGWERAL